MKKISAKGKNGKPKEGKERRAPSVDEKRVFEVRMDSQMSDMKESLESKGYKCTPIEVVGGMSPAPRGEGHILRDGKKVALVEGRYISKGGTGPGDFKSLGFTVTTQDPEVIEVLRKVGGELQQ